MSDEEKKEIVTEKAWLRLYRAAVAFRDLHPWKWTYDSDLFGVKDPLTGEIGFCCVMGNLGRVFALAVYQGKSGLKSYQQLAHCEDAPEDTDIPLEQECLMASFENKGELFDEDKEIIKKLKLKFEGENAWPMFRKYSPGQVPWFLNPAEVKSLTIALEQAAKVCPRFKTDRAFMETIPGNVYFVRVSKEKTWHDELVTVEDEKEHFDLFIDEDRLKKIVEKGLPRKGVWEIDLFYSPFIIQDQVPHYYPRLFMCCEQSSGYVMGFQLFGPDNHYEKFANYFLEFVESVDSLPVEVRVKKDDVYSLLYPLLSVLKVRIIKADDIPAVREAKKECFKFLKKPKAGRNESCPCGSGKKYKKCCGKQ